MNRLHSLLTRSVTEFGLPYVKGELARSELAWKAGAIAVAVWGVLLANAVWAMPDGPGSHACAPGQLRVPALRVSIPIARSA